MTMEIFEPRAFATPVYQALSKLRKEYDEALVKNEEDFKNKTISEEKYKKYGQNCNSRLKEQKNQAVELYTYLSTWGLMRLKAEELALNKENLNSQSNFKKRVETSQYGKLEVVQEFFKCLEKLIPDSKNPDSKNKLELCNLSSSEKVSVDEYLGIMGLALALAQEFSFWATAIYHDIKGDE